MTERGGREDFSEFWKFKACFIKKKTIESEKILSVTYHNSLLLFTTLSFMTTPTNCFVNTKPPGSKANDSGVMTV